MAYASAQKRNILNFDSGTVYEIALKYPTGKQVSNGRVMFSTTDDEVFFVDPFDADAIYDLKLALGEKFRLTKHGRNGIEVKKIDMEQPVSRPAAPVAVMSEVVNQQTAQPSQNNNSYSKLMASSYIAAIDALMIARDYAESKGIQFKLSPQELRSSAHCIFIASQKGAR